MPVIKIETFINAPPNLCFDLTRDIDVHVAASTQTGERAVAGVTSGKIGLGETVTWEGVHFMVRQRLTSMITVFEPPTLFVDEMQDGPFKRWKHSHQFFAENDGTRMVDRVEFASPFGALGALVDMLVIKSYMTRFLLTHNAFIKQLAERLTIAANFHTVPASGAINSL
jgi:ligand-binding SRPBCC domain-containing protein